MRRLEVTCKGMEKAPLTILILATIYRHPWIKREDIKLYIQEYTCYKEKSIYTRLKYCRNNKWIKRRGMKYALTRKGKKHIEKVIYWWIKYIDYIRRMIE